MKHFRYFACLFTRDFNAIYVALRKYFSSIFSCTHIILVFFKTFSSRLQFILFTERRYFHISFLFFIPIGEGVGGIFRTEMNDGRLFNIKLVTVKNGVYNGR